MKVHLLSYGGRVVAAFSSRNKLLRSFTIRMQKQKYYQAIIDDLKNMLNGIYRNKCDKKYRGEIKKESLQEMLNMLSGEDYNYGLFTYEELILCTDEDYILSSVLLDR